MCFKERLEDLIETVTELTDLKERSEKTGIEIGNMYLYKNIEDGILDNIHKANKKQLIIFLRNYIFGYYCEYNDNKDLLKNEINRRLRDNKLKQLIND